MQESENATAPAPFSIDDSPIARELADSSRRRALDAVSLDFEGTTRVITVSNQKGGVGRPPQPSTSPPRSRPSGLECW